MKQRLILGIAGVGLLAAAALAISSEGEEREESDGGTLSTATATAAVDNPLYAEECGSCHVAYPAGLLPARSWDKLMSGLADHFGENAELSPEDTKALTDYLTANAGDNGASRHYGRIVGSIPKNATPLRITQVPYIVHEHREVPARMVTGNPKVKSLANCDACHTRAAAGSFNEHEVRIPGYGAWDD